MRRQKARPGVARVVFDQVSGCLLGRRPIQLVREARKQPGRLTPELRENAAVVGESAGLRGRAVIHSVAAFESRPAAPSGAINSVVFDCLIMVHVAVGLSTA
jgi:hypothetical protein